MRIFEIKKDGEDPIGAGFAGAMGGLLFFLFTVGRFITRRINEGVFGFALVFDNLGSKVAFAALVLAPIFSWFLIRHAKVKVVSHGFFLGFATSAVVQAIIGFVTAALSGRLFHD